MLKFHKFKRFLSISFVLPYFFIGPKAIAKAPSSPASATSPVAEVKTLDLALEIKDPWIRETAPGQTTAAFYGTLHNRSKTPLQIHGLEINRSQHGEFHQSRVDAQGVVIMEKLPNVIILPGESLSLAPGKHHGMLMGLSAPFRPGEKIPGKIHIKGKPDFEFVAEVRP